MAVSLDKVLLTAGLLAVLHAAYSAAQHRAYLRLTEQTFSALPADILLQCIVGLLLTCYALIQTLGGSFREIRVASEADKKSWENLSNRTSFYCFNHRGKALFGMKHVVS